MLCLCGHAQLGGINLGTNLKHILQLSFATQIALINTI